MKTKLSLIIAVSALLFVGACSTATFTKTPIVDNTGQTNGVVVTVSPEMQAKIDSIKSIIGQVPTTGVPYVDLAKDASLGLLGLFSTVLTFVAKAKSTSAAAAQALAAQHKQAADLLAAAIVKSGQSAAALQVSSGTDVHALVAQHIDNNTV